MDLIPVELAGRRYEVQVARGLLAQVGEAAASLLGKEKVLIVADARARALHGEVLESSLVRAGHRPRWYEVEPGEGAKSWEGLIALTEWLLEMGVERGDHVLALGGGVVGDLAGFACAIVKRGCGFIQLPTTLLAQVDSSVGGKTAINSRAGKNLVGAFHQPSAVFADLATLDTLDRRQMRAGFAEVLKYGVIGDAGFFAWLEENAVAVLAREESELARAVATSIAAKARIVARDERETSGVRALLNLGHTFGHALEAQTGFCDRLYHGEAVALGMVLAARYSARLGLLPQDQAARIERAIASAGLPSRIGALGLGCDGSQLVAHMAHDKKAQGGKVPFVLLKGIGKACLERDVEPRDVARFLDEELARR